MTKIQAQLRCTSCKTVVTGFEDARANLLIHCTNCDHVLGSAEALRDQASGLAHALTFAAVDSDLDDMEADETETMTLDDLVAETEFDRARYIDLIEALESQPGIVLGEGSDLAPEMVRGLRRIVAELDTILAALRRSDLDP